MSCSAPQQSERNPSSGFVFVIKLISFRVDLLPVLQFLLVEPSIIFRGEFVALDLGVEVVGDDGVRLHEKRIARDAQDARFFLYF